MFKKEKITFEEFPLEGVLTLHKQTIVKKYRSEVVLHA